MDLVMRGPALRTTLACVLGRIDPQVNIINLIGGPIRGRDLVENPSSPRLTPTTRDHAGIPGEPYPLLVQCQQPTLVCSHLGSLRPGDRNG